MAATYTIVAVARTPQSATDPTLVELGPIDGSISYTDKLNEAGSITVTVDMETLQDDIKDRIRDPLTLPMEIWVYRDSTLVAAGPLVGGEVTREAVTLAARGLEYHTAYMSITTDESWAAVDVATICKNVVDDWQALSYGDYGIDASSVPTIGTTRTVSINGTVEPISVYDFLLEQSSEGFDFWVDPTTRDLKVSAARGSDLSASVYLERGVTSEAVRFAVSPGLVASEVFAIGTGPNLSSPLTTTKSHTGTRTAFGRAGATLAADPVEDATLLGDLAQEHLDERNAILFVPGPALVPVVGAGVEDFGVGDIVTYTFDAGLGQQTGAYRVVTRTVTVADNGQESITMEFA